MVLDMNVSFDDNTRKGLYVIRFLNTHLAGCEYLITEPVTHYVVNSHENIRRRQELMVSPDYVFVTDDTLIASFEIHSEGTEKCPLLLELAESEPVKLEWQTIQSCNGVCFALKSGPDIEWTQEIIEYSDKNNSVDTAAPDKKKDAIISLRLIGICAGLLAIIVVAVTGIKFYSEHQRRNELSELLGWEPSAFQIGKGKDIWYVFAESTSRQDWAKRALARSGLSRNVTVINKRDEATRIAEILRAMRPDVKFHLIRLDNPFTPEIVLSTERGGLKNEGYYSTLRAVLTAHMPYAENLSFSHLSDKIVADQAEQEIRKSAAIYSLQQNKDSVTFIARGALDDNELNQLKASIQTFNENWQGNYIRFAIELENDWLKGKSYQYGADGYVKMNTRHWYFPLDIKELK